VWLDVEEAAGPALAVVGLAGDEAADERRFAVVDVPGRTDHEVVVVRREHRALSDGRESHESGRVALAVRSGAPRLHVGDVGVGLLGEQREDVHRLGERLGGDAGEPTVVGDAHHVRCFAVTRENAVSELGDERLHPTVCEVDLAGEPLFELDRTAVALAALQGPP